MKHRDEYRDIAVVDRLIDEIQTISRANARLMEVCGTHTVSIFRSGIRSLLPKTLGLLSGPGCPVCVTAQGEIDAFIALTQREDVIVTTFGDLMRVPGDKGSLQVTKAEGRDIRIVYSAMDALAVARDNPDKAVVFLGVGFETTAPTVAAAVVTAEQMGLKNFMVYAAHKTVPAALHALVAQADVDIDGFILPGHVSVIIGLDAYREFFDRCRTPCVVSGFEPADILQAVRMLVRQIEAGQPALENAYARVVTAAGNTRAQQVMARVFEPCDALWRGLGPIAGSGLRFTDAYRQFDAARRLDIPLGDAPEPKGCACGAILTGAKTPPQCALYKTVCTPMDPVGPCMVSTEGTCAAYYRYHRDED